MTGTGDPDQEQSGPAFPIVVKGLAALTVGGLVACGAMAAERLVEANWTFAAAAFIAATCSVILVCFYWIVASRTTIDASSIRQSWVWNKEVALTDIRDVKFVYVPHLAWLIAPRLVVRARGGALYTFHAADVGVLRRFAELRFGNVFRL